MTNQQAISLFDDCSSDAEFDRQIALVEQFKQTFDIPDSEVPAWIQCHKTALSNLRGRRRKLTWRQELCLYDFLGYAWARKTILAMCPEQLNLLLVAKDNLRSRKRRQKR